MFWYRDLQAKWEKFCHQKQKMDCITRITIHSKPADFLHAGFDAIVFG